MTEKPQTTEEIPKNTPRCWPWRHQWEVFDKVETKGWFGSTSITLQLRCKHCAAVDWRCG